MNAKKIWNLDKINRQAAKNAKTPKPLPNAS